LELLCGFQFKNLEAVKNLNKLTVTNFLKNSTNVLSLQLLYGFQFENSKNVKNLK